MAKLHEVLPVDANLKAQATKVRTELLNTFEKKTHLFTERVITFQPNEEGAPRVTESQLDLQTTVPDELKWISEFLIKSLNASYQVAQTNTYAVADIVLEGSGEAFLTAMPATALLDLEHRMRELLDFVKAIPTLDPAKGFTAAPARSANVYQARDVTKKRTKKVQEPLVLAPATDKHAAQVQLVTKDVEIGTILEQEWSGLITSAAKGMMLERVEALMRAIKTARARANEAEVRQDTRRIGATIINYIFGL